MIYKIPTQEWISDNRTSSALFNEPVAPNVDKPSVSEQLQFVITGSSRTLIRIDLSVDSQISDVFLEDIWSQYEFHSLRGSVEEIVPPQKGFSFSDYIKSRKPLTDDEMDKIYRIVDKAMLEMKESEPESVEVWAERVATQLVKFED